MAAPRGGSQNRFVATERDEEVAMSTRAEALAQRVEEGAAQLAAFAKSLSDDQWRTVVRPDGRTVGVIVHHVAHMYPIEVQLAGELAAGRTIAGVTWEAVAEINAKHAEAYADVSRTESLAYLERQSRAAADAVRQFTDEELDRASAVSLNGGAPLTTQFFIEDHALRHSWHHLARIRDAVAGVSPQQNAPCIAFVRPTVTMAVALLLLGSVTSARAQSHEHGGNAPSSLVQIVREATHSFLDVLIAQASGYGPAFGCVSGPQEGAMGVHYINAALVADGELDAWKPEALMYEVSRGRARLLGVEYIVDAATWLAKHGGPPVLEGQLFHFVASPNRYGLPAFFELHVWAWRDNPSGTFADWNPRVSCNLP
jgi:hypothetical protein